MKKVFVYGDSISMQYGFPLKRLLKEDGIEYDRLGHINSRDLANPENNGISTREMKKWIDNFSEIKDSILVFNCGLHDIVHINYGDLCQVTAKEYEKNLLEIVEIGRKKFTKMIFCNSTPVEDERHNKGIEKRYRYNADIIKYNRIAAYVMEREGIPIIDLYSITDERRQGENIYIDHVHMKESISELQAKKILDALKIWKYIDG